MYAIVTFIFKKKLIFFKVQSLIDLFGNNAKELMSTYCFEV